MSVMTERYVLCLRLSIVWFAPAFPVLLGDRPGIFRVPLPLPAEPGGEADRLRRGFCVLNFLLILSVSLMSEAKQK